MTQEPGANTDQLTRSFSSAFLSISYKKQLIFYVEERKSNIRIKYLNLDKKKKLKGLTYFFLLQLLMLNCLYTNIYFAQEMNKV